MGKPALSRIHVNQLHIKANAKDGGARPVISVKRGGKTVPCQGADIVDGNGLVVASVVYRPDKPLSCGARVWIESRLEVVTA